MAFEHQNQTYTKISTAAISILKGAIFSPRFYSAPERHFGFWSIYTNKGIKIVTLLPPVIPPMKQICDSVRLAILILLDDRSY